MNIYVVKEMLKEKNIESIAETSGIQALNVIEERIENFLLGR